MTSHTLTIRPIGYADTYALRHAVLWPNKPLAYVQLGDDPWGYHAGAFYGEELVAVISLFVRDGLGRFRKFATHPDYQRRGIGTQLLHHLLGEATRRGAVTLWCDARADAVDFYRSFGMHPEGSRFYKGIIPYQKMSLALPVVQ